MNRINSIMKKTAEYIEAVQPKLDKLAEYDAERINFVKRASQAAGVLANRGIIDRESVNEVVDNVASDPSNVWDLVEKMATAFDLGDLGDVSNQTTAVDAADPWEREFLGARSTSSGMID